MQLHYKSSGSKIGAQSGSILLNAIVTTIIIAIISGVILQQSLNTVKTLRAPRIKAAMTAAEGGLRQLFMQPATFTACTVSGFASCNTAPGVLANVSGIVTVPSLYEVIPGCMPAPCGVRVRIAYDWGAPGAAVAAVQPAPSATPPVTPPWPGWDAPNRTFAADIVYEGTEIAIQPRRVVVLVPVEVLQVGQYTCPSTTPIFQGYNADGSPKCRAITYSSGVDKCAVGYYVAGFNSATLQVQCEPIGNNNPINCNTGFLNKFIWNGGNIDPGCLEPRPLPSVQYGP